MKFFIENRELHLMVWLCSEEYPYFQEHHEKAESMAISSVREFSPEYDRERNLSPPMNRAGDMMREHEILFNMARWSRGGGGNQSTKQHTVDQNRVEFKACCSKS